MRVTSADVAERAGVSRATVSYVLNDTPGQTISEPTRDAVMRAARELGYRPNPGARSLRSGRSDIVLFPLPQLETTHVFGELIEACARKLREYKLTLVTDFTTYDSPDERIDAWLRVGPAVVIDMVLRRDDPTHEALRQAGIPVVQADRFRKGPKRQRPIDSLSDEARAIQVEYILEHGHSEIVFAVPSAVMAENFGAGRQTRMHRSVKRSGANLAMEAVELQYDDIGAAVDRWLARTPRPTVVCAYNDEFAVAILSALVQRDVRVPEDIAVIGVDNDPIGAAVAPPLTSVDVSVEALADSITASVHGFLDGGGLMGSFDVPPFQVVQRASA